MKTTTKTKTTPHKTNAAKKTRQHTTTTKAPHQHQIATITSTPHKHKNSKQNKIHHTAPQTQQKRGLFGLFDTKNKRVVYELSQSVNPLTLRTTLVPTSYKFPNYLLPSIDIVSVSSQQVVTPTYDDLCYVMDKTPKVLQLPTISAVTNDSKFVNVFAEITVCISSGQKFSLVGENFLQVLQSLSETAISNVVSTISEEDLLDKQYEEFVLTKSHEELQRLFEDIGVDVLKTIIIPQQLDLTNVAAQLNLIKTMNDLSMAINTNNNSMNILSEVAANNRMTLDAEGGNNGAQVQSNDLTQLLTMLMENKNQQQATVLRDIYDKGMQDEIEKSSDDVQQQKQQQPQGDVKH